VPDGRAWHARWQPRRWQSGRSRRSALRSGRRCCVARQGLLGYGDRGHVEQRRLDGRAVGSRVEGVVPDIGAVVDRGDHQGGVGDDAAAQRHAHTVNWCTGNRIHWRAVRLGKRRTHRVPIARRARAARCSRRNCANLIGRATPVGWVDRPRVYSASSAAATSSGGCRSAGLSALRAASRSTSAVTDGLKLASTESSSADRQRLLPVYRADPDRSAQRAGRPRCRSTEQCGEFAWEKGDLERSAIQEFRHARNETALGWPLACVNGLAPVAVGRRLRRTFGGRFMCWRR